MKAEPKYFIYIKTNDGYQIYRKFNQRSLSIKKANQLKAAAMDYELYGPEGRICGSEGN